MTDKRVRGDVEQRFTRVHPMPFEGTQMLQHRWGGNQPLPVCENMSGVFLSSWLIDAEHCRKFLEQIRLTPKRGVVLSLVVDTNVPGHPTVSMQLQEIFLT